MSGARAGQVMLAALLFLPFARAAAQTAQATTSDTLTTRAGVYSTEQAQRGEDVYFGNCRSCHTPESHAGPAFVATWSGRPLSDLFVFIRDRMPRNEPGSLSAREYADVLSYLLRMNRMPAGHADLPADSAALHHIRIQYPAPDAPTTPAPRPNERRARADRTVPEDRP